MEQFRQIGESLGSLRAMMVFKSSIQINQRQCALLFEMLSLGYETIADKMLQHLIFEERHFKWRVLEKPLREMLRVFKEGEQYVQLCLDANFWWARVISLYQSIDCVEFHIHNLLCSMSIVLEAVEIAAEGAGVDLEGVRKKKVIISNKYQKEQEDPAIFSWMLGRQHLVSDDFCSRMDTVWMEDRWHLLNKIKGMSLQDHEKRLVFIFRENLDLADSTTLNLLPCSVLVGSKDYYVTRRLGNGSQYKEIFWLGESFVLRHFFGDIAAMIPEISTLLSLSHPHILCILCGFTDEDKRECFLVTELMSKDMSCHIKEICGPRRRIPFSLPVAVDLMLQIARGLEYLHTKKICHGDINPSNILFKSRSVYNDGYMWAKVSGFGPSTVKRKPYKSQGNHDGISPSIWHAPEVLAEQEQSWTCDNTSFTEKSDVYSFGMVCFQILTGKVPFEDSHLQGDNMTRNIRAGERPLFPFNSPKYVTSLTKKCWHSDPTQRPGFSSICRILRHVKRFLVMNPDHSSPDPAVPVVEYSDIEARFLRKSLSWGEAKTSLTSHIPFHMFVYRIEEKEKTITEHGSEAGSDGGSLCGDDNSSVVNEQMNSTAEKNSRVFHDSVVVKKQSLMKKSPDEKISSNRKPGKGRGRGLRPPQMTASGRSLRINSESPITGTATPKVAAVGRRRTPGHASSDSDLP